MQLLQFYSCSRSNVVGHAITVAAPRQSLAQLVRLGPCVERNPRLWRSRLYSQGFYLSKALSFTTSARFCSEITFLAKISPRISCVMENMKISEDEIFEKEELAEQEEGELYLGKEKTRETLDPGVDSNAKVPPEIRECWDLWQRVGLPVAKIAKQRKMTETGVFYCIFTCIQNDFYVDWYELCKEAKFTPDIASRLAHSAERLVAESKGGPVEWASLTKLQSGVTEVQFGLFLTMLRSGFSSRTILNIASQKQDGETTDEWGRTPSVDERFPAQVKEAGLVQWLQEKDGASLLEIALKYRECDEAELMNLLLDLEKAGRLFRRQGIYRVM